MRFTPFTEHFLPVAPGFDPPFIVCPSTLDSEWTTSHDGRNWFEMGFKEKFHQETNESLLENAKPAHRVTLSRRIVIMKEPVNRSLWHFVMSRQKDVANGNDSMTGVSWDDCYAFIQNINKDNKSGFKFSLPTEAQWEYACQAGERRCPALRTSGPNHWEICSMCSGCFEWCLDDLRDYAETKTTPIVDPKGPLNGTFKALRGGNIPDVSIIDRPFARRSAPKSERDSAYGFRLVCPL